MRAVHHSCTEPRILFVDDEPNVREAFRHLVKREGFCVDVAESGSEALALAKHHHYQVVVTDIAMPGMDGRTLIEQLRLLQRDANYIAVTALRESERDRQSFGSGDVLVFDKPWDSVALSRAIRAAARCDAPVRRAVSTAPDAGVHVLLVEDNPGDAELFRSAVRDAMGHASTVTTVSRVRRAVEAVTTENFDVVVADLTLPDAHELESVVALHEAAPSLPIVALTGYDDDDVALKAVQAGAQDFLVKGETGRRLLRRVLRYSIERKRNEQRLLRMAHYDALTGLANRVLFRERLAHAIARSRRTSEAFCIIALDLDGFKTVNDELGHPAGDALLKRIAAELNSCVRESDTVARFGGDEFMVLLEPLGSEAEVETVCQRLLEAVSLSHEIEGRRVSVTASIGVATHPGAGDCADTLLWAADNACYEAKTTGKNQFRIAATIAEHSHPSSGPH